MGTKSYPESEHREEGRGRVVEAQVYTSYPPLVRLKVVTLHNKHGWPLDLQAKEARWTHPNADEIPENADPEYADKKNCWKATDVRYYQIYKPEEMKELVAMAAGATTAREVEMITERGGVARMKLAEHRSSRPDVKMYEEQKVKGTLEGHLKPRPDVTEEGAQSPLTKEQKAGIVKILEGAYVTLPIPEMMMWKIQNGTWGRSEQRGGPDSGWKDKPEAGGKRSPVGSLVEAARAAGMNATVKDGQTVVTGRDGSRTLLVPIPEKDGRPEVERHPDQPLGKDWFTSPLV